MLWYQHIMWKIKTKKLLERKIIIIFFNELKRKVSRTNWVSDYHHQTSLVSITCYLLQHGIKKFTLSVYEFYQ